MPALKREGINVLMVITVAAAVLDAFYYFMQIVVFKLSPPPRKLPYWRDPPDSEVLKRGTTEDCDHLCTERMISN